MTAPAKCPICKKLNEDHTAEELTICASLDPPAYPPKCLACMDGRRLDKRIDNNVCYKCGRRYDPSVARTKPVETTDEYAACPHCHDKFPDHMPEDCQWHAGFKAGYAAGIMKKQQGLRLLGGIYVTDDD